MNCTKIKFELLYKGSRDGWNHTDFHSRCDNQGASVTLFYCSNGRKCGGFTSQSWDSSGKAKSDSKSFLFSLDNKLVFPVQIPDKAIHCAINYSPTFGKSGSIDLSAYD